MTAVPPLIPGDMTTRTLDVKEIAKIKTLYGNVLSTLNTWKGSVKASTTANITLSGTQTIDNVTLVAGDTILVKNQTIGTENGIYVVKALAWQRRSDFTIGTSVAGAAVFVNEGSDNVDRVFVCINDPGSDVVGTDALTFSVIVADSIAVGPINAIQVSDGSENVVASAATASVTGLITSPVGFVATTGGLSYGTATGGVTGTVVTASRAGAGAITANGRRGLLTITGLTNTTITTSGAIVVTNTEVAAGDLVMVWTNAYSGQVNCAPIPYVVSAGAGTFTVQVTNAGSATLNADVVIGFNVIKAL